MTNVRGAVFCDPQEFLKLKRRRNTNDEPCNHWGCNTHTHTHTHGNLIKNKKINIYTIFMCFFIQKNLVTKNI